MGMFDKRLEVGIATAAAILTTATASFSPQTSQLTMPKPPPEAALSWKGISATPEQRETQQTETLKALNAELDRSPQERKDEITQRLEGQIARLGRGLQLEPKQDESVQEYKTRAEGRASDLMKLNALYPSAFQHKDESFEEFSARVVREYFEDNTKRNADAKALAHELNKK